MSLLVSLRKKQTERFATATPATFATLDWGGERKTAITAKTAVANLTERKPAPSEKVGAGELATASRWWRIHYPERHPVEVACLPPRGGRRACTPEATHAEILEDYPDAVAAEPFTPLIRQPSAPMTAEDETAIRAWLATIEETDPAMIAEVLNQCQRDADARDYFTKRACLPKPDPFPDDRRTCDQCANLIARRCQAAKRGEIVAGWNYKPIRDLPRRCEGYAPGADDPDRRHGRERWPGLIQNEISRHWLQSKRGRDAE